MWPKPQAICTESFGYLHQQGLRPNRLRCEALPNGYVLQASAHGYCELLDLSRKRPCRYLTLLREPTARMVSAYRYYCQGCAEGACSSPDSICPNTTLLEYAAREGNQYTAVLGNPVSLSGTRPNAVPTAKRAAAASTAVRQAVARGPMFRRADPTSVGVADFRRALAALGGSQQLPLQPLPSATKQQQQQQPAQTRIARPMLVLLTEELDHGDLTVLARYLGDTSEREGGTNGTAPAREATQPGNRLGTRLVPSHMHRTSRRSSARGIDASARTSWAQQQQQQQRRETAGDLAPAERAALRRILRFDIRLYEHARDVLRKDLSRVAV